MNETADHIGPFQIRGKLGRGAMAVVWRGYDPSLDREVAIKEPLLPPESSDEVRLEFAHRFIREGRAAARLNHPGIVTIYSAAAYERRPVIVMELIEGPTLRTVLKGGRLTTQQTFALLDQLLQAVGYAHEHGITHRDLKPDNVFITREGTVKLADFGIAQLGNRGTVDAGAGAGPAADAPALTRVGQLLGTPAYMSPERIRGEAVDARCDVFALGVIAYECLAGANPFGSESSTHYATIIHRIMSEPTPPLELTDSVAGPLAGVIAKALEKQRENRFENAVAMLSAWRSAYPGRVDSKAELAALCGAVAGRPAVEPSAPARTEMWGADAALARAPVTTLIGADEAWHAADVKLQFAAKGADGIATHTQYRLDDGSWRDGDHLVVPAAPSGANDGRHTVSYRASDAAGLVETPRSAEVRIDATPPVTTVSGADEAWHASDVTLEFAARDEFSGVAATEYRVGEGPWTAGTRLVLRAVADGSNDGAHAVAYRSRDNAGNLEAEQGVVVRIDAGAPRTQVDGADKAWHANDVLLRLTATDPHSGVEATEYRVDEGPWVKGDAVKVRAPRDGGGDGEHRVRYRSRDKAGNLEAERTALVRIDATPPRTTVQGGGDARRGGGVTVQLAAADAHSGVARTEYRLDGGAWREGTVVTIPESPAGVHRLEYRSVDRAGNVAEAQQMVVETRGAEEAVAAAPPSSKARAHRRRRSLILVAIFAALIVGAGVAAFALTRPSTTSDPASDQNEQQARAALETQAKALAAIDSALTQYASDYAAIVEGAQTKAAENEDATAAWQKEWDRRLSEWKKKKAAVDKYNANRPSTPASTGTRTVKTWDSFSESWVYSTETYTVPGTTAAAKSYPPRPKKPKKVSASLKSEQSQMAALGIRVNQTLAGLDSSIVAGDFDAAKSSLLGALSLLSRRTQETTQVFAQGISTHDSGEVVDSARVSSLSANDVDESAGNAHGALVSTLQSLGLPSSLLDSDSKDPAGTPVSSPSEPTP